MCMNPFTVVMAVYNGDSPRFINEALTSLFNQARQADEILIVVDGVVSKGINKILDEFDCKSDMRVIRLPVNQGAGVSRDTAIAQAKHNIIAIMDADDICEPSRFEKQLPIIEKGDAEVVGALIEEFIDIPRDNGNIRVVPERHKDIYAFGKWRQPVNHVSIIFTRDAYYKVGGYSKIRYVEDYDFLVRLLLGGVTFYNIQEVLVHVRLGATMNRRSGFKYLWAEIQLLLRIYRWKYLNVFQLSGNISIRLLTRLLPRKILTLIYKKTLRQNKIT
jgi:glycosyltransferase involved in cell wall biosynthesis